MEIVAQFEHAKAFHDDKRRRIFLDAPEGAGCNQFLHPNSLICRRPVQRYAASGLDGCMKRSK